LTVEARPGVDGLWRTALPVARRSIHNFVSTPAQLAPALVFPLFFLASFAGGLSAVADVRGFDFPGGYTAFQFVFVLFQSATFGGALTGLTIAADFESGFARRYLLAAPHRRHIILGYGIAGLVRALLAWAFITVVALACGMRIEAGGLDLGVLYVLAALVNVAATLWSAGVALRLPSVRSGPLMQLPLFLILFLAPVFVPLDLLRGWIRAVASVNPATPLLDTGRALISGQRPTVVAALSIGLASVVVAAFWAAVGMRRIERG
jgi:ABC-2 type transport system permease protein